MKQYLQNNNVNIIHNNLLLLLYIIILHFIIPNFSNNYSEINFFINYPTSNNLVKILFLVTYIILTL